MLTISLIASALLYLIVNMIARSGRPRVDAIVVCCIVTLVVFFVVVPAFLPGVAIQSFLLGIAAIVWMRSGRRPSFFHAISFGATLLAYVPVAMMMYGSEREYARLRRLYPYESMQVRVPEPKRESNGVSLTPAAVDRLVAIERRLSDSPRRDRGPWLKRLHEGAVELFVNSAGFGNMRAIALTQRVLENRVRREDVPPQPGARLDRDWSPGDWIAPSEADERPLSGLLLDSIEDFANPSGFGFIKDRWHVAGFESHRFSAVPGPAGQWEVRNIELVSLLLHDQPEVYVSDRMPEMKKAHETPTRPLDRFERFGLDELERGEDLFISEAGDGLRMLGAVRSAYQCVDCHGGGRGDLLGAFSYSLKPGSVK